MVTKFTSDYFPNTHIEFTQEGVLMILTLNIEKGMRHYMSPNNVVKGKHFWTYIVRRLVPNPCSETIKQTYNEMLSFGMIRCRDAKIAVLENEKKHISERRLFY